MSETKLALMERLRKEKRWDEAERFREETRTRLRSAGMRRAVAREEAWRLTAEKFAPLQKAKTASEATNVPTPNPTVPKIAEVNPSVRLEVTDAERSELIALAQTGNLSCDLTTALNWVVSQGRSDVGVTQAQASSLWAWAFAKLDEADSDRFIALIWADYGLRHGLTLSSILWAKQTDNELRLRHQFAADMKRLHAAPPQDTKAAG